MLHDTCDRTLLLGKWLVLVGYVMKRGVVEWLVVVERRGELEHRGRDLLLLNFTCSSLEGLTKDRFVSTMMVKLLLTTRGGRGVDTRNIDCERLQWAPWWANSRRCRACLLLLQKS